MEENAAFVRDPMLPKRTHHRGRGGRDSSPGGFRARGKSTAYEIILVNDGSPDGVADVILQVLCEQHPEIVFVNLSRNFGQHSAADGGANKGRGARSSSVWTTTDKPRRTNA